MGECAKLSVQREALFKEIEVHNLNVYEIRLRIYVLQDIKLSEAQGSFAELIDKSFLEDITLKELHETNVFKNYCFDLPYPIEKDKIYHKGKIYTVRLRTVNSKLAIHFSNVLVNEYTKDIKALSTEVREIAKKPLEKIYSITPAIMKSDDGYWKGNKTLDEFEKRLFNNLVKKYKYITGLDIDENFQLYKKIEFINQKPIAVKNKGITLLGDKVSLTLEDSKEAQELAWVAIGCGLLENNARGNGFMNFCYL